MTQALWMKAASTWLPAFTSPIGSGDQEIVVSMTHGGHNYLWNYKIEEKCANKHMQETSWVWRHKRNRKSTVRRGIKSPLLLLQVLFLLLDFRIWKIFSSLKDSMILWAKEVWMLTKRWCKSIESPNFAYKRLEHLWPQKKHENNHQVSCQGTCAFFYLRKSSTNRQTKLKCWHEILAVHFSLVSSKHGVLGMSSISIFLTENFVSLGKWARTS